MKTNYFTACKTLEDVKKHYKNIAMIYHPDRGGDTARMQEINAEYAQILKNPFFSVSSKSEQEQEDLLKYPEIINQVIGLSGVVIEIIGDWIWLSGNTYPFRLLLKEIGFFFAPKKVMWYFRPPDYKSTNKSPKTIDYIRTKYGSDVIENNKNSFSLK